MFTPIAFVVGLVIGRWWAVPLGSFAWPVWLISNGREIQSSQLTIAVIGAVFAAFGVWSHKLLVEDISESREDWKIWWHDRGWRQH
jgi:hypothetical protein